MLNPFEIASVTFATPLAMLVACHDRVRHYAALTRTLVTHLEQHGADAAAIAGAQSILRYFDVAAPLHHQDEDEDLFAAMLPLADPTLRANIEAIMAEHDTLGALWQEVRQALLAVVAGDDNQLTHALAARFAQLYPAHALREEEDIYPYAKVLLDEATLAELGRRMAARRGQR